MTLPNETLAVESPEWVAAVKALGATVTDAVRDRLAKHWLHEAALEHASVGSFARNGLQLMALGAPPDLLAGVHLAALDEIRHARVSYTIASAYAGESFGPGPLAVDGLGLDAVTAHDVALETFFDGCVNETCAALVARRGSEDATEPAIRAALTVVADDEEKHAELAWRSLAWLLRAFVPDARTAIASAVGEIKHDGGGDALEPDADDGRGLGHHGVVSRAQQEEIRRQAIGHVVIPCVEAMLATG